MIKPGITSHLIGLESLRISIALKMPDLELGEKCKKVVTGQFNRMLAHRRRSIYEGRTESHEQQFFVK